MPEMLGGAEFRVQAGELFEYPLHHHEDVSELLLIVEGEGDFCVDGESYRARAGSMMIYNRCAWHEERSNGERFSALHVSFRGLQLKGLPSDHLLSPKEDAMIVLKEHFVPVRHLLQEMIAEKQSVWPESAVIATQLLGVLIGRLVRMLHYKEENEVRRRPARECVHLAKRYMEENYHTDVDLQALSEITHVNVYHLIHVFKSETGLTPIQFLIQYRLEVAKHLLANTRLPMADIAEKVGYQSETYFQNLFKKASGVSPGKYRSLSREETDI